LLVSEFNFPFNEPEEFKSPFRYINLRRPIHGQDGESFDHSLSRRNTTLLAHSLFTSSCC
jgi:hypothetical protein